jgi:hypothetical protein
MSKNKKISAFMSAENKQEVLHNLTSLEGALQNAVSCNTCIVSPASFIRMNNRNTAFVNKALIYARKNPVRILSDLNVINAKKKIQLAADLTDIHSRLSQLVAGIKNTINSANAEAYETALVYYKILKENRTADNKTINRIVNDLENYCKASSRKYSNYTNF